MRALSITLFTVSLVLISGAASAGNLSFSDGRSRWQSTRCMEPAMPPPLAAVNSETGANDMNSLMESYNAYADQMQQYMNCVSAEAQSDSDKASEAIIASAQDRIGEAQDKVSRLHDTLRARQ